MEKVRAHVFVSGRVQGVFFRSETASLANEVGVAGWVRNLPDGRVEAVFEGENLKVERMISFCRKGPPGAHVTKIDLKWESFKGESDGFKVAY